MTTNMQFSIAVHLMAGLGFNKDKEINSNTLAASVNACPSFVRRVMAKLSRANLVNTTMGKGGNCSLAKDSGKISLLDIYQAVEAPKAFAIHNYPVQEKCIVSSNIKTSMEKVLNKTQNSLEESLKKITLADVIADIKNQ